MKIACRIKTYIQPFERKLALCELEQLTQCAPVPKDGDNCSATLFEVDTATKANSLVAKLAYWESVSTRSPQLTTQVLREATVNTVRNGVSLDSLKEVLPFDKNSPVPLPNRRVLRYASHGIHEYRGKFFPQLVRSLLNCAGVNDRSLVVDPMCGSGTTVVEAILRGCRSIGFDLNPLSVFIAKTKCALLLVSPDELGAAYEDFRERLLHQRPVRSRQGYHIKRLSDEDQEYLMGWFSESALSELDVIMKAIDSIKSDIVRDFFRISMSNVLRRISWQKEDDLRVRKQIRPDCDLDPVREYLDELGRSVRTVVAFQRQLYGVSIPRHTIDELDARSLADCKDSPNADCIITSPPYATALPYLDTDRLSLVYLGLLTGRERRQRDKLMIGNREITGKNRTELWDHFDSNRSHLPAMVCDLIDRIHEKYNTEQVGFRRRNLPSLLAKYFMDMQLVIRGFWEMLKPGGIAFVVVGSNHTTASGERILIDTPVLLSEIAVRQGFLLEKHVEMEMLASRDIFRQNAGESERILWLRKSV